MLISQIELLNIRLFASYSKHAKVSNQILINISLDYKVVITTFSYHLSIVKLIILLNGCNGQLLPISEGSRGDSNK
jgi:hypothetical protein